MHRPPQKVEEVDRTSPNAELPWPSWKDGPLLGFSIKVADPNQGDDEAPFSVALVYFQDGHELDFEHTKLDPRVPIFSGASDLRCVSTDRAGRTEYHFLMPSQRLSQLSATLPGLAVRLWDGDLKSNSPS